MSAHQALYDLMRPTREGRKPEDLAVIVKAQTIVLELLQRSGVPFRFRDPVREAIAAGRKAVGK